MYYWLGLREDGKWEVFTTDTQKEGTAEATGYEDVRGPYLSKADAEADL